MSDHTVAIRQMLSGENAFYNQPDYKNVTRQEMASSKPPSKPTYTHVIESKVWRAVKDIFSVIVFPVGLYRLIHFFAGRFVLPASSCKERDTANKNRKNIDLNDEWKVKRISVKVDGHTIDSAIIGKISTLANGRWLLLSDGNEEVYEKRLNDPLFKYILSKLDGNAIIFNYPGVGSSTGMPSRSSMSKTYRAMLHFLEKGIGAKEIIGHGYSIGGGVQGDALRSHELKQGIKYVFVKNRTFSDLSTTVSHLVKVPLINRLAGFFIKVIGWNMDSVESSKKLKAPEIIMQTANVPHYMDISGQPEKIIDDGTVHADASLAKKLLQDGNLTNNKFYMGIPEKHDDELLDPDSLVQKMKEMMLCYA